MHREDNSRYTTATFSWVLLADMDLYLTCDLKLISRETNVYKSYSRPEYSCKIARWTLNTNQSINQSII